MDAVLTFCGGLLAFAAVLFPVVRQSWRRAVSRGTEKRVIGLSLSVVSLLCLGGASVARFAYHNSLVAIILHVSCLLFAILEFLRRPWQMTRGEIIAIGMILISAYSLVMGDVDGLAKESETPKTKPDQLQKDTSLGPASASSASPSSSPSRN